VLPGAQGADLSGDHADQGARDGERAELAKGMGDLVPLAGDLVPAEVEGRRDERSSDGLGPQDFLYHNIDPNARVRPCAY
jgi:hypothetical protein